ncbi:MAG TPA: polysaccharide deacetylase family protein [Solirubrobacteraceae bacterium]|nr:polysaccharide deacetylase family protein [Solirubrobacteraceae bacterium]
MSRSIVLCYHALSPSWQADLSTTPQRFERQISLLIGRGYRPITFTEAAYTQPGGRTIAITFDDAYLSVLELARPILDSFAAPATVFVPTDYIGHDGALRWPGIDRWHGGADEHELTPMSWSQLQTLARAGWEIGSHTGSHPHLTKLDNLALADELARSKATCEAHIGTPCTSLAYPYGDVDERVVAATASAGYRAAAALPSRLDSVDPLRWPRVGVYRVDYDLRFRVKLSPAMLYLRRSRAWEWLARARR